MTQEDIARFDETCEKHASILRLFHEAGGKYSKDPQLYDILEIRDADLPRLFEIFAAAEREACADICDQHASIEGIAQRCAVEIRARNKP